MTRSRLLFLLALGLYLPFLSVPFQYDDLGVIRDNESIRSAVHLPEFFTAPHIDSRGQYAGAWRPIPMVTFAANYAMSGIAPWSYRLTNALLHATAVVLLFAFLRLCAGDTVQSFLGALLFAVHPLQTQTVLHVWKRTGLMSAMFMICGCVAFLKLSGWKQTFAVLGAFVLALFCKEDAVLFPVFLVALAVAGGELWKRTDARRTLAATAVLGAAYFFFFFFWIRTRGAAPQSYSGAILSASTVTDWGVQWVATWRTLGLIVWPDHLNVDHCLSPAVLTSADYISAKMGLAFLMGLWIFLSTRKPWVIFGGSLVLLSFLPFFAVPLPIVMDDSRSYLPLVGMAFCVALVPRVSRRLLVCAAIICAALVLRTEVRASQWRDGVRLWSDSVKQCPTNTRALNGLTFALIEQKRPREALRFARKSARINPYSPTSWMAVGRAEDALGDSNAEYSYRRVIALNPASADAWNNLGAWLADHRRFSEAAKAFEKAISIDPHFQAASRNLSVLKQIVK